MALQRAEGRNIKHSSRASARLDLRICPKATIYNSLTSNCCDDPLKKNKESGVICHLTGTQSSCCHIEKSGGRRRHQHHHAAHHHKDCPAPSRSTVGPRMTLASSAEASAFGALG